MIRASEVKLNISTILFISWGGTNSGTCIGIYNISKANINNIDGIRIIKYGIQVPILHILYCFYELVSILVLVNTFKSGT